LAIRASRDERSSAEPSCRIAGPDPHFVPIPEENLAARVLARENAGLVVPGGDREAFAAAARAFDIAGVSARLQDIARRALAGG